MSKTEQWVGDAKVLFNHLVVKHNKSGLKCPATEEELDKEHHKIHQYEETDHAEWNMAPAKQRRKSIL